MIDRTALEKTISYSRMQQAPSGYRRATIVRHYAKLAQIAVQAAKLIEMQESGCESPELDEAIDYVVRQLKTNHLHDFGIELEWSDKQ